MDGRSKMTDRRARSDSAAAAAKAMMDAGSSLPVVPGHVKVRPGDGAFLDGILRSRTRDEWTPPDLVVAMQLARCQADIEKEHAMLEDEGSVIDNFKGTPIVNPRHAVLEQLSRRELALLRALQMVGSARGDKRDVEQSRNLQRQAEKTIGALADEDLLAT